MNQERRVEKSDEEGSPPCWSECGKNKGIISAKRGNTGEKHERGKSERDQHGYHAKDKYQRSYEVFENSDDGIKIRTRQKIDEGIRTLTFSANTEVLSPVELRR